MPEYDSKDAPTTEQEQSADQQPQQTRRTVGEVHTMPDKFYSPEQRALGKPKKKKPVFIILAVAFFGLMASFAIAVFLLNRSLQEQNTEPVVVNENENLNLNTNANANLNTNLNENENTNNANANENVNENDNANTNTNLNENGNSNANLNTNSHSNKNSNTNVNLNLNISIPDAKDGDKDGLTDGEEEVYGTEAKNPDTDDDGYLDGAEVESGYSPTGPELLKDSTLAKTYTNSEQGYTILYPAEWPARATNDTQAEVIFTSETSEFIEVLVEDNPSRLSIYDWFLIESPGIDEDDLVTRTVDGFPAVMSLDGMNVYVGVGGNIFTISYNIGLRKEANFRTTLEMMIQSISITPVESEDTNVNTNTNTNTNVNTNTNTNVNE